MVAAYMESAAVQAPKFKAEWMGKWYLGLFALADQTTNISNLQTDSH